MRRLVLAAIVVLCSCSVMTEREAEMEDNDPSLGVPKVKSAIGETVSKEDSLRLVYQQQTSKEAFMQDFVNFSDGRFYLSISRDLAKSYGVSDELYDKFVNYVRSSNEQLSANQ